MPNQSAVELTRELLHINTINPPGNERPCAQHLGRILQEAGFTVNYYEFADTRTCVVATVGEPGIRSPLCFTGHIDTVPLGTVPWSRDPFAGEITGNRLYGRGASDMKSGVAAFVVATVKLSARLKGTAGVVLVITAGEETGCEGAVHLERLSGALGRAGAIVVGEPTGNYPYVGHKGAYWLQARTKGVTAHGSMPELGDNAIYKAARAVGKLEHYAFPAPQHILMGKPTLNVGTIRGGLNVNSVPDEANIGIDIRTIPNLDHKDLHGDLSQYLGAEVELNPVMDVPSVYTDPHDPWVQSVFEVMAPLIGERPQARTASYFTDAAALRKAYAAPPTIILGPGEPGMAHQTDEYCFVDKIEQAVQGYEEITRRWCGL